MLLSQQGELCIHHDYTTLRHMDFNDYINEDFFSIFKPLMKNH